MKQTNTTDKEVLHTNLNSSKSSSLTGKDADTAYIEALHINDDYIKKVEEENKRLLDSNRELLNIVERVNKFVQDDPNEYSHSLVMDLITAINNAKHI